MTVKNYIDVYIRRDCSFDDIKKLVTQMAKIAKTQDWGITLRFNTTNHAMLSWQPKVEEKS